MLVKKVQDTFLILKELDAEVGSLCEIFDISRTVAISEAIALWLEGDRQAQITSGKSVSRGVRIDPALAERFNEAVEALPHDKVIGQKKAATDTALTLWVAKKRAELAAIAAEFEGKGDRQALKSKLDQERLAAEVQLRQCDRALDKLAMLDRADSVGAATQGQWVALDDDLVKKMNQMERRPVESGVVMELVEIEIGHS